MNRQHLMIILSVIIFSMIFGVWLRGKSIERADKEIETIEKTLEFASYSAVCTLAERYGDADCLEEVSGAFFEAFSIASDTDSRDLWMYVPAFVFLDKAGFSVGGFDAGTDTYAWTETYNYEIQYTGFKIRFTLDDIITVIADSGLGVMVAKDVFFDSNQAALPQWEGQAVSSIKDFFLNIGYTQFTEENYLNLKRSAISTSVARVVNNKINYHNEIAGANGLTYLYSTPAFLDTNIDLPSFVICFQGYPLTINGTYYSNLVSKAGFLVSRN